MNQLPDHYWSTFILELAIVVLGAIVAVVVTLEVWPPPYLPGVVGLAGLVAFSLYRLSYQMADEPAEQSAAQKAAQAIRERDEEPSAREGPGGLNLEYVDENIVDVPDDEESEADADDSQYLDPQRESGTGLVSKPPSVERSREELLEEASVEGERRSDTQAGNRRDERRREGTSESSSDRNRQATNRGAHDSS